MENLKRVGRKNMYVVIGIMVGIGFAIAAARAIFIAGKNNYHGVPIPTTDTLGHYKLLGVVKTEKKGTFATMERVEDGKITSVNVTATKEELLVVGNVLFF